MSSKWDNIPALYANEDAVSSNSRSTSPVAALQARLVLSIAQ
jgi:hypothetical protein